MTAWQDDGMGWDLDVVEVPAGTLPGDRQVVAVLDADSRAGVYYVDTSYPLAVWLKALSNAMTESAREFVYVGDIMRPPVMSA